MDPSNKPKSTAPKDVGRHAHEFFDAARLLLADRFAEARFDPDRGLRVTIIELNDQDKASITNAAEQLGILDWIRIEHADPAALATWERLRHDLLQLQSAEAHLLMRYPTPDPGYRRPPVDIHLSADAETTAADLHHAYGDFVALQVGALPYPPKPQSSTTRRTTAPTDQREPANPAEMHIALEAPLEIRSGQTRTHGLLLTNLGTEAIRVHTNGNLTATILNNSGAVIGGYNGAQITPLIIFTAGPSETIRIPVLVGSASYQPELGYTIPPGTWHLTAPLDLADGRRLTTPALELTITD
ncbi:hypothetical protein [Allobranchiibius sp. GilTou73]|uniref:hypothetical protein n=1 Tax=Allobranchiibius sp. GilTou73 TaxID=2904523 RepID=UPI001F2704CE|nr:hypothetical protein [Allobranchiibius sp. GilTou73]UIJ35996.1 hypothetical protein LVQ62_06370 [Allobranchiibius sp. GilTou73]